MGFRSAARRLGARGWLLRQTVVGPGVFASPWDYQGWQIFIAGTAAERKTLIRKLPKPAYFLATPLFTHYYGDRAKDVIADPCLAPTQSPLLYQAKC